MRFDLKVAKAYGLVAAPDRMLRGRDRTLRLGDVPYLGQPARQVIEALGPPQRRERKAPPSPDNSGRELLVYETRRPGEQISDSTNRSSPPA